MFFYPEKGLRDNPVLQSFPHDDVSFKAPDGVKLHGWFFKANSGSLGTILVMHGNAENISTHINSVLWLVKEGFDVFAFDYRGYGLSEGKTTVHGVHLDADAALETVLNLAQANKERIFILGQSVGGPIAIHTLANSPYKDKIKALITDSSFSDYRRIAREKLAGVFITWPFQYPLSFLFNNRYSPEKQIKKISPVPILLIHGDSDRIVPAHHSSILYKEALEPKDLWIAKGRGHIEAFAEKEIRDRLAEYLKSR
ncbi:MAG: alpha/beta hydrolase [Deltaproteobacteria bacterium]|nr:alpha/beta hydrolase [Deltaproteobacteria bacterium]